MRRGLEIVQSVPAAYIASPPVTARKAAPTTAKASGPPCQRYVIAGIGLKAASTSGERTIPTMPSTPITANQTSITGPNKPPIQDVPLV